MSKLAFVCLLIIQSSLALHCKKCKEPTCANLEDETCGVGGGGTEAACLTHIFIGNDSKKVTDKKCVVVDKNRKFVCDNTGRQEVECTVCMEDNCNSGAATLGGGAIIVLVAAFVFR